METKNLNLSAREALVEVIESYFDETLYPESWTEADGKRYVDSVAAVVAEYGVDRALFESVMTPGLSEEIELYWSDVKPNRAAPFTAAELDLLAANTEKFGAYMDGAEVTGELYELLLDVHLLARGIKHLKKGEKAADGCRVLEFSGELYSFPM